MAKKRSLWRARKLASYYEQKECELGTGSIIGGVATYRTVARRRGPRSKGLSPFVACCGGRHTYGTFYISRRGLDMNKAARSGKQATGTCQQDYRD
jgi:hypothetical protein